MRTSPDPDPDCGGQRRRILVTGGAGFVGANLAIQLAVRHPSWDVVALDNLRRRGSELNLPRLSEAGVDFVRGDVREVADVLALDPVDAVVESSAEPSALAGTSGDTRYVVDANLLGAHVLPRAGPTRRRTAHLRLHEPRLSVRDTRPSRVPRDPSRFELIPPTSTCPG